MENVDWSRQQWTRYQRLMDVAGGLTHPVRIRVSRGLDQELIFRMDGECRHLEMRAAPLRDDDGTANRVQLQQVILNLVRNAADAMVGVDDGPRQLLIRTERDVGDRVRLTGSPFPFPAIQNARRTRPPYERNS